MRIPSRKIQVFAALLILFGVLLVFGAHQLGDFPSVMTLAGTFLLVGGASQLGRAARSGRDGPQVRDLEQSPCSLARAQELARVGTWWYHPGKKTVHLSPEHIATGGLDSVPAGEFTLSGYLTRFVHPQDRDLLATWISGVPRGEEKDAFGEVCYRVIGQDGNVRHMQAVWIDDEIGERLVVAQDITDRKTLEEKLLRGVLYDSLTGLPNRSLFEDRLSTAMRREGPAFVGVALMDIDRFLAVNASLGREAGDSLLLGLAVRLVGILPPGVTVARMGEDEFAALLETESIEEATAIAHRMKGALASPLLRGSRSVSLTASIGLAVASREEAGAESLLQKAETALFQARNLGTDNVAVFDEAQGRADREEVALEMELRQATGHGELELHYQPVVRLADLATIGFEALVRWRRPGVGLVSPALFIPMAERTGSVHEIGQWVLNEALATLREMSEAGRNLTMAINVSARQMEEADLVTTVREALERHRVDPKRVHLEITESALATHPAEAAGRIGEIRALGVRISLDDFGTGFSSLGYLHRFPVDTLKIDKSFVDLLRDGIDTSPVPFAVVGLAHSLEMDVVAEGIEVPAQLARLKEMGCESGQGYLFSRPLPKSAAEAWYREKPQA